MDGGTTTTIAALASAPGPGRRGIVRLSGPACRDLVLAVWRPAEGAPDLARRGFSEGRFEDGVESLPGLLLWMPGPRSFTREDVAELHLPGAPPLLARALERLYELGAEPAAPGEFTRRAFASGRIDLTRAEGVLALVEATGEAELRAARALLAGGLARRVAAVRDELVGLRALCEASLDFDESETGHVERAEIERRGDAIAAGLREALDFEERRVRATGHARVVLRGAPNAGKSALFNALCPGARALVSEHAGTTRDVVAAEWGPGGVPARLFDTAGRDEPRDGADREAQARAEAETGAADLVVWAADATRADLASDLAALRALPAGLPRVLAWTKVDLGAARAEPPAELAAEAGGFVAVSASEGTGLAALAARAAEVLGAGAGAGTGRELAARHRRGLARAAGELETGFAAFAGGLSLDLLAERLRRATDALDAIEGRTAPEDVLDQLFARFCIGK